MSRDFGRDRHRHIVDIELAERAQRHHRLVERDRDERRQLDRPLGLETQHLERSRVDGGWRFAATRGEVGLDRGAGLRRTKRFGRPVEVLDVVGVVNPLGQPVEDLVDSSVAERLTGDDPCRIGIVGLLIGLTLT